MIKLGDEGGEMLGFYLAALAADSLLFELACFTYLLCSLGKGHSARILSPNGIKMACKPNSTLRGQLMKLKITLEEYENSAAVSSFNCKNSPVNYFGEIVDINALE